MRRLSPAALLAAILTVGVVTGALATYVGRPQPTFTGHVSMGYAPHDPRQADRFPYGDYYRQQVSTADSGDVGAVLTATVPLIYTSGYSQIGLSCTSNVSTASFVLTPLYGSVDSGGNWQWDTGSDVTITCDSEFTSQGAYTSGKTYVDTDGYPVMRILVKSISSGDVDDPVTHTLTRLRARVN